MMRTLLISVRFGMDVPSYLLCSKFLFPLIVYHNTKKEKREIKKIAKKAIRTKKPNKGMKIRYFLLVIRMRI